MSRCVSARLLGLVTLVGCHGEDRMTAPDPDRRFTISGRLARATRSVTDPVDRVVALPHRHGLVGPEHLRQAVVSPVAVDGGFSLEVFAPESWVLLLEDSTAPARERVRGWVSLGDVEAALTTLPGEHLTDDIDAGAVFGSGDEANTTSTTEEVGRSLDLDLDLLRQLAHADDAFRLVASAWVNWDPGTERYAVAQPSFVWAVDMPRLTEASIEPDTLEFFGYQIRMSTSDARVTSQGICVEGHRLEVVPPAEVRMLDGTIYSPESPFAVGGAAGCPTGNTTETQRLFSFPRPEDPPGFIVPAPWYILDRRHLAEVVPGWWSVRVDGEEIAVFDLARSQPVDDAGLPMGLVPALDLHHDSAGLLTGLSARWNSRVENGGYAPVPVELTGALLAGSWAFVELQPPTTQVHAEFDRRTLLEATLATPLSVPHYGTNDLDPPLKELVLGWSSGGAEFNVAALYQCGDRDADNHDACVDDFDDDDPASYNGAPELCTDGKDNDGDGIVDGADSSCHAVTPGTLVFASPGDEATVAFSVVPPAPGYRTYHDIWATLEILSPPEVALAPGEDGAAHLGDLYDTGSGTAYFQLAWCSTGGCEAATGTVHAALRIWGNRPSLEPIGLREVLLDLAPGTSYALAPQAVTLPPSPVFLGEEVEFVAAYAIGTLAGGRGVTLRPSKLGGAWEVLGSTTTATRGGSVSWCVDPSCAVMASTLDGLVGWQDVDGSLEVETRWAVRPLRTTTVPYFRPALARETETGWRVATMGAAATGVPITNVVSVTAAPGWAPTTQTFAELRVLLTNQAERPVVLDAVRLRVPAGAVTEIQASFGSLVGATEVGTRFLETTAGRDVFEVGGRLVVPAASATTTMLYLFPESGTGTLPVEVWGMVGTSVIDTTLDTADFAPARVVLHTSGEPVCPGGSDVDVDGWWDCFDCDDANPSVGVGPCDGSWGRVRTSWPAILSAVSDGGGSSCQFDVTNIGIGPFADLSMALIDSGAPAPAWATLFSPPAPGALSVGGTLRTVVGLLPAATVPPSTDTPYQFALELREAGQLVGVMPIAAWVDAPGVGAALFRVEDIFTGTFDEHGQVIQGVAGAVIALDRIEGSTHHAARPTDQGGEALFLDLPVGSYRYTVQAPAYASVEGTLVVQRRLTSETYAMVPPPALRHSWTIQETLAPDTLPAVLGATLEVSSPAVGGSSLIDVELPFEVSLDTKVFDAELRLWNDDPVLPVGSISVVPWFTTREGSAVAYATVPEADAATTMFFVVEGPHEGITAIDGTGTLAPSSAGIVRLRAIPTPAAAVAPTLEGILYLWGVTVGWSVGGVPHQLILPARTAYVVAQPKVWLDAFLDPYLPGDNAHTGNVEPSDVATLGLRVSNRAMGTARSLGISGSSVVVVSDPQALGLELAVTGAEQQGMAIPDGSFASLGDLTSGAARTVRWFVESPVMARAVTFSITGSHPSLLGGELTSVFEIGDASWLLQDVLVDFDGRDAVRDFVARAQGVTPGTITMVESDLVDLPVADYSDVGQVVEMGPDVVLLEISSASGWGLLRLPLPAAFADRAIASCTRSDGKMLDTANCWVDAEYATGVECDGTPVCERHFIAVLDATGVGVQLYEVRFAPAT